MTHELDLVAGVTEVTVNDAGLVARAYTFNGTSPGPQLMMQVGDTAVIHFKNELPYATLVHWHGIELDNANDGTTVTQNLIETGSTYNYRFVATRPGIFWYHPHSMPTNPEFKGLFGSIIVTDEADVQLAALGVIPNEQQTHTLMLSDTTVCKTPGENDAETFAAGADVPWAFSESIGPFPGLIAFPTPADLCEMPRDREGRFDILVAHAAGDIPNIMPAKDCSGGGNTFGQESRSSCRVNEGQLVLTNGHVTAHRSGTPDQPGAITGASGIVNVAAGDGVRLRLLNAAVSRYFRLRLTDSNGTQIPLMRIGGEGGLLDKARLEGGTLGTLNTKFAKGEIVLGVANRADIVFAVPATAQVGDVLTLWTLDFQHYGTAQYPFGYAGVPTVPVAHFKITETGNSTAEYTLVENTALLTDPRIDSPTGSIKDKQLNTLLEPTLLAGSPPGVNNNEFLLAVVGLRETIDGIHGTLLEGGDGEFTDIPHLPTSRYARLGDTLELKFRNGTQMHHPMHLHGFSYQPVRLEDLDENIVYEYDYDEYVDTFDVPAFHQLVMRVHLEDRPLYASGKPGGGAGRWLLHCHIFNHAGLGMITEIVVLDETDKINQ
jgi:FtsP/CotA-like multicopper oxidase with cupredoxin domain